VRGNLLYGHALTPAAERYVHLEQVVELLGLGHLLERRPGALSGGEKQRVAIGRALLASPRLLLLDEPLAALDNFRKGEVLQYIERLRDEFRLPIIYVSHSIEEVTRLADTMVVLSRGETVAAGSVSDIMSRLDLAPFTGRFEAGAVIEARVAAQDLAYDLTRLEFTGGHLFVSNLDALIGEPVRVRIRARDVAIALQRPPQASFLNVLGGRIEEISRADSAAVDVRIDVSGTALLARVTRRSVDDLALAPGKEVFALVKAVSLDRHSVGYV
jgi:molybdate transport system ATP-binding protein